VTERFYSGRRDGQVTVREGFRGAEKRPLEPRSVLFKRGERDSPRPAMAPRKLPLQSLQTLLAMRLLR